VLSSLNLKGEKMRYWNNRVEQLHKLTTNALPEPWKRWVQNSEIELYEVPEDIKCLAMIQGTESYQADLMDNVCESLKSRNEG